MAPVLLVISREVESSFQRATSLAEEGVEKERTQRAQLTPKKGEIFIK
jgi:hypothetical protein